MKIAVIGWVDFFRIPVENNGFFHLELPAMYST